MTFELRPPDDELTPTAEWLLQSARAGGQVTRDVLAEALAFEHAEWLRRLGAVLFPDPHAADALLVTVLSRAVHEAHTFEPAIGARPWLASLAIETAERMQHNRNARATGRISASASGERRPLFETFAYYLPLEARAGAILRLLCGFSRDELSRIPNLEDTSDIWMPALKTSLLPPVEKFPAAAEQAQESEPDASEPVYPWSRANPRRAQPGAPQLDPDEQRLSEILQAAHPAPPSLSQERLNALAAKAARRAGWKDKRRRRRNAINEIALVSLAILVVLLVIWGADRLLPPDEDAPRPTLPRVTPVNYSANTGNTPQPTNTPMWQDHVAYVVQPGDTLDSVALAAGVSVAEIQRTNGLTASEPLYTGQALWVKVPAYADPIGAIEWIKPEAHTNPLLPLLSADSTPADIFERLRIGPSLWSTLWADYQMVYYGPQRYNAEPRAYRFQVWVSQPDRSLEIFNELSNEPDLRHITLQGRSYTSAVRYTGAYLDPGWNHAPDVLLTNPMLRETIYPSESKRFKGATMLIKPLQIDSVAGRAALITLFTPLDSQQPAFKLWIDRRMGLVLRRQMLEPDTVTVISDMTATHVALDATFPAALFNPVRPWQGGFADGPSGKTAAPGGATAPTPTWALPVTPSK